MISTLGLANFKCFKDLSLDLGSINVLAGMNGAGKSTIIQSLLTLRQSWDSGGLRDGRIDLNGTFTQLGTTGEVYCAEPNSDSIGISLVSTTGQRLGFSCKQSQLLAKDYFLTVTDSLNANDDLQPFGLFSDPFNYLHAERLGPRKVSQIETGGEPPLFVGMHGEFAPFIAESSYRDRNVDNQLLLLRSDDGVEYPTLRYQFALWMNQIFPGFDIESEVDHRADQIRLGLALQRLQTGQRFFVRPPNTGFGLSFVFGIVVACLVAQRGTLLIIENPEAHLHPKAQSAIGELVARTAAGGTQVLIETHSEHVVNGIRRMVKENIVEPGDARVYFFSKGSESFEPDVVSIQVAKNGGLSAWPPGFFDQLDADLSVILE